jgi:hypothetical protein
MAFYAQLPKEVTLNLHAALQANMRLSHRNPERIGQFTLNLDCSNPNPYLNYAVPDDDIDPSLEEIERVVDTFRSRDRQPRFEYVPAAAPRLEAALVANGFTVENRLPIPRVYARLAPSVRSPSGDRAPWSFVG